MPIPPSPRSVTLVPEITGLLALAATVMDELAPVAASVVVPCWLLIDPLMTMPEVELTTTSLLLPPMNLMLIGFDALTVLVSVSVR